MLKNDKQSFKVFRQCLIILVKDIFEQLSKFEVLKFVELGKLKIESCGVGEVAICWYTVRLLCTQWNIMSCSSFKGGLRDFDSG
jgi:hypothetical protein